MTTARFLATLTVGILASVSLQAPAQAQEPTVEQMTSEFSTALDNATAVLTQQSGTVVYVLEAAGQREEVTTQVDLTTMSARLGSGQTYALIRGGGGFVSPTLVNGVTPSNVRQVMMEAGAPLDTQYVSFDPEDEAARFLSEPYVFDTLREQVVQLPKSLGQSAIATLSSLGSLTQVQTEPLPDGGERWAASAIGGEYGGSVEFTVVVEYASNGTLTRFGQGISGLGQSGATNFTVALENLGATTPWVPSEIQATALAQVGPAAWRVTTYEEMRRVTHRVANEVKQTQKPGTRHAQMVKRLQALMAAKNPGDWTVNKTSRGAAYVAVDSLGGTVGIKADVRQGRIAVSRLR